jgi:hypothetical protein
MKSGRDVLRGRKSRSRRDRRSALESVGEIARRMRRQCESEMTTEFCPHLSLRLDLCLALEQCAEEGRP